MQIFDSIDLRKSYEVLVEEENWNIFLFELRIRCDFFHSLPPPPPSLPIQDFCQCLYCVVYLDLRIFIDRHCMLPTLSYSLLFVFLNIFQFFFSLFFIYFDFMHRSNIYFFQKSHKTPKFLDLSEKLVRQLNSSQFFNLFRKFALKQNFYHLHQTDPKINLKNGLWSEEEKVPEKCLAKISSRSASFFVSESTDFHRKRKIQ